MDPIVYAAAMEGEMEILGTINPLDQELAPNGNTVLHIAAKYGKNEWIQELLRGMDPSSVSRLLGAVNCNGETALHVAAREGRSPVIEDLLQHAKELDSDPENGFSIFRDILTCTNEDGDTALHMALRSSIAVHLQDVDGTHKSALNKDVGKSTTVLTSKEIDRESSLDTVTLLIFPSFAYLANKAGETPLYLAAECECSVLVRQIAETVTCSQPDEVDNYSGPGGRTALHAAVASDHEENTKYLLDWKKDLVKKADMRGWTPLHCAAEFGRIERVKQLLGFDKSLAYQTTTVKEDTALHIASRKGFVSVIKELVSQSPGCWEMVNARGQNVLHVAVEKKQLEVIKYFEQNPPFLGSLINQKDNDGNTPIHLAARDCLLLDLSNLNRTRLTKMSFNKENKTPLDLLAVSDRGSSRKKKAIRKSLINAGLSQVSRNEITISAKQDGSEEKMAEALAEDKKQTDNKSSEEEVEAEPKESDDDLFVGNTANASLVVAALVATVTFTAGITVPGGYNGNLGPNQGTAMLFKLTSFKVFMVADAWAFLQSTVALLLYLVASLGYYILDAEDLDKRCSEITYFSVLAMVMAFIAGTYSVLSQLPSLAVPLCIVTSIYLVCIVCFYYVIQYFAK